MNPAHPIMMASDSVWRRQRRIYWARRLASWAGLAVMVGGCAYALLREHVVGTQLVQGPDGRPVLAVYTARAWGSVEARLQEPPASLRGCR